MKWAATLRSENQWLRVTGFQFYLWAVPGKWFVFTVHVKSFLVYWRAGGEERWWAQCLSCGPQPVTSRTEQCSGMSRADNCVLSFRNNQLESPVPQNWYCNMSWVQRMGWSLTHPTALSQPCLQKCCLCHFLSCAGRTHSSPPGCWGGTQPLCEAARGRGCWCQCPNPGELRGDDSIPKPYFVDWCPDLWLPRLPIVDRGHVEPSIQEWHWEFRGR